jgi:hypothetical protein
MPPKEQSNAIQNALKFKQSFDRVATTFVSEVYACKNLIGNLRFQTGTGLKRGQTKPKVSGTVRQETIPNDSGRISACFDDDPKLSNCEIAQPTPSHPRELRCAKKTTRAMH